MASVCSWCQQSQEVGLISCSTYCVLPSQYLQEILLNGKSGGMETPGCHRGQRFAWGIWGYMNPHISGASHHMAQHLSDTQPTNGPSPRADAAPHWHRLAWRAPRAAPPHAWGQKGAMVPLNTIPHMPKHIRGALARPPAEARPSFPLAKGRCYGNRPHCSANVTLQGRQPGC